ncbi:hypothetical protein [Parapedobacter tibetensis]|uniref:hypothetical protein n=1 Tax=Parapedobacter tibetensis TaxID=2972951 RepID=UPI00214D87EA|nr:hypothetical protein [Parapedobacter tibetensis]
MNKFIISKDAFYKNVLFEEDALMASDENYEDETTFRVHLENGKKGKLDTHLKLAYTAINKIVPFPEENIIQVFFNKSKAGFSIGNAEDYKEILNHILSKKPLQQTTEQVGGLRMILKPALYTLAVAIIAGVLISFAKTLEDGNSVSISGGKRGIKRILVGLAETLGLWGTVALGVLLTGGFLFYTIKQYKSSKVEMVVYK